MSLGLYEPRTMGELVERIPPVRTFLRDTFFRNVRTFVTKRIDVDFKKGQRTLAPFVHPKNGGGFIPGQGYRTQNYEPPTIAPYKITTAHDLLHRTPGENPYSGKSPTERAVEKLAEDMRELQDMIARREEWMAASAIFTGTIPIVGDGLNEVIDFSFTNRETITTAAKKWSSDSSDPLADLERWHTQVQKNGYVNCNLCIMSADTANAFVHHGKVKDILDIKAYDLAVIAPRQMPNGVTYIGTIHKLGLDIYQYNTWYLDDWTTPDVPEEKPLVPEGTLALLSTEAQYSMYYGAIVLLDETTGQFITQEGRMVPQSWTAHRPDRRFLQLNSRPLPVPHDVDSWFVAKVL